MARDGGILHERAGVAMSGERRRPAPETAKDILGQLDTALGRIGRARGVAEAAGFAGATAALAEAERGITGTMDAVEAALREDLAAAVRGQAGAAGAPADREDGE
jgi:hypothetical protein